MTQERSPISKPSNPGHVDHLIYAVPDLAEGIDRLAGLLGVTPTRGGSHTGFGTANALVSLGARSYLEIMGPDPDQPLPAHGRLFGIDTAMSPKLMTWAIEADELEKRVEAARGAGYDPGEIIEMGRETVEGEWLEWRLAIRRSVLEGGPPPAGGLVPFMIDWGETPHPAPRVVQGCSVLALRGSYPDPGEVQLALSALGVELEVLEGDVVGLTAELETPAGRVVL